MTNLSEQEPDRGEAAVEDAYGFGVRDWMEAILARGVNGTMDGEPARIMPWFEPMTDTQYLLRRIEMRPSPSEASHAYYSLQVYPLIDAHPTNYLYGTDTRQTLRCDVGGRILGPGDACYQHAETELLDHLRTAPSYTWPRVPRRLPDAVVEMVFKQRYAELFGTKGLQRKVSWWLADMFSRLRRTGREHSSPQ